MSKLLDIFLNSKGVNTDTRTLQQDQIFFALKGDQFDGNKYAISAIQKGASFAVIDQPALLDNKEYKDRLILQADVLKALQNLASDYREKFSIPVLGITGSNGKTTTKELCAAVLSNKYIVHYTKGNLNNHIGVPLTLLSAPKECTFIIVEMGANHLLEIDELCNIAKPNYGLITNIGKAHLEGFGGTEGVKLAKSELYRYLDLANGKAFIDVDDKILNDLIPVTLERIKYSTKPYELKDENAILGFEINGLEYSTHLIGDYNIKNIACAVAVGQHFGVSFEHAISSICNYKPMSNRSQLIQKSGVSIILDAYNSNPTSLSNSIASFLKKGSAGKVLILGDMLELGSEAEGEHKKILDMISSHNLRDVILIGEIFSKVAEDTSFHCFQTVEDAKKYFDINKYSGCEILLKGSRGIAVEKILND